MKVLVMALFCIATTIFAKPVAVVCGGQHGEFDARRLIYRVLLPNEWVYHKFDKFLEPSRFSDFSAVVWFSGASELNEKQLDALKSYVEQGGTVVFTGASLPGIVKRQFGQAPFLGVTEWRYSGGNKYFEDIAWQRSEHPVLAGVDTAKIPAWAEKAFYAVKPSAGSVSLLGGRDGWSLLSETSLGKGKIYYLWEGLFRIANAGGKPEAVSAEKILANILRGAGARPVTDVLNGRLAKGDLVFWQRDWQEIPQAGPAFIPPYPEPGEIIGRLEFFSAVNERDTQFVVCQSPDAQEVPLQLPAGPFRVYVSAKPPPIPSLVRKNDPPEFAGMDGNYYLMPPGGSLALEPGRPRVLWVQADTAGLKPGAYKDKLVVGGKEIPLALTVYPVAMPEHRPVVYRFWGAGTPMREPFLSTLQKNNIELWMAPSLNLRSITLKENGMSVWDAAGGEPELLLREKFPELVFPDTYRQDALAGVAAGFSYVRFYTGSFGRQLAERALKRKLPENLAEWPPEAQRIFTGLYGEYVRFLNEYGFYDIDAVWLDEPSRKEIEEKYLFQAELLNRAGMGNAVTWTAGTFDDAEMIKKLTRLCSTWDANVIISTQMKNLKAAEWHPRRKFGLCASGNGFNSRLSPGDGRAFARNLVEFGPEFRFVSIGPFWKEWLYYIDYDAGAKNQPEGIDGERMLAYADPDKKTLATSPFMEGMRDGIDEMNLLWMLDWYAARLDKVDEPAVRSAVAKFRAGREKWHRELNFTDQVYGTRNPRNYRAISRNMPAARVELFKKQLLDALMEMKPFVAKHLKPEYYWNNRAITGVKINDSAGAGAAERIRPLVPEGNLSLDIDLGAGIGAGDFRMTHDGMKVKIAAGDAAGARLGIQAFINNLRAYGNWL